MDRPCFRIIDRIPPANSAVPIPDSRTEVAQIMRARFPDLYADPDQFALRYESMRAELTKSGAARAKAEALAPKIALRALRQGGSYAGQLDRETILELLQIR